MGKALLFMAIWDNAWFIPVVACAGVLILVFAFVAAFWLFKRHAKAQQKKKTLQAVKTVAGELAGRFGGPDNIVAVTVTGSRVTVALKNTESISAGDLEKEGLRGALIMSDKVVFPIGTDAEAFAAELRKRLGI